MTIQTRNKLNQLITEWPRGTVYVSSYLSRKGYSRFLLQQYKKRWITTIGRSAFILREDKVDWMGGLYAIQHQLNRNIHLGGLSALYLKGYTHYISPKQNTICLFGGQNLKLPQWFKNHDWEVNIEYTASSIFDCSIKNALTDHTVKEFSIIISSPELAILELLQNVPQKFSFDFAEKTMENLMTLRTDLLENLLANCNSIKVKRLFLYLAEKSGHSWFKKIKKQKINIGHGNRKLVIGGTLDTKYLITVPKESSEGNIF